MKRRRAPRCDRGQTRGSQLARAVPLKRAGFKVWAIARDLAVPLADVQTVLYAAGWSRDHLNHPQQIGGPS